MSRPSWFEFTTAILGLMRKRASPCWLQLCTVGSYHPRPLRDVHSSRRILRVRRAPRQSLRSVPTNIKHTSQHLNGVSAAAGAPGTDAAADALAAVGVNCSSSSSELSACWLGSSTFRTVPSLLTAVFDWNNVLTAYLRANSMCQCCRSHCCSKSLKQYPYKFECGVRYVFGFVR